MLTDNTTQRTQIVQLGPVPYGLVAQYDAVAMQGAVMLEIPIAALGLTADGAVVGLVLDDCDIVPAAEYQAWNTGDEIHSFRGYAWEPAPCEDIHD